jgi:uncharacterized membrane protein YdjX (TVP38/TMEM64 family)
MPLKLVIILPITILVVGVLVNHAFARRREEKYREFWANMAGASAVAFLSAFYLATDPGVPMETRNVILGLAGAFLGATVAVWGGSVLSDRRAKGGRRQF